ncbi:MFS transporter [Streptomyces sp. NPDC056930]|uniref:MFS transporter n=1 Tax=Streptomyces sp. NPDC056930 TaxID=3345967 RepID=UPI003641335C
MPSASAANDSHPPAPPGLWRDSDFRRLWVGQTASQLGEHAVLVVLPLIAVLTLDADAGRLGALRAVGQAPILLLSLFVGAWVDRWRTRTVMVLAGLGRALALGGAVVAGLRVPALHGPSAVTIPVLMAVNFVFGAFGQLVNVTVMAVRQAVTPDGMQGRAAATITCAGMGLTPLGSLLGGLLAQDWGLRTGLLATAAGMMLSPLLMALSPLARLGRTLPAPQGVPPTAAR